jgi:hypothetical protein
MSSDPSRQGLKAPTAPHAAAKGDAEPAARLAALEDRLEEHSKQLNRLIGERNQLRALLDSRDQEIWRLHREVGALRQQIAAAPGAARPSLRAALGGWLGRRAPPPGAARPAARQPAPPLAEPAGAREAPLTPRYQQQQPRPVLAAAVFGLNAAAIERLLPMIDRQCQSHSMQPLLLTDDPGFEPLRARRLVFEYLPPPAARARLAGQQDWPLYLQRRLAVIRRKWQPARIVAFGPEAMALVELWRASPFEAEPIPAILAPPPASSTRAAGEPAWSLGN